MVIRSSRLCLYTERRDRDTGYRDQISSTVTESRGGRGVNKDPGPDKDGTGDIEHGSSTVDIEGRW